MNIDLQGSTSYQISGNEVAFTIDRVANITSGYTSGTIKFELWAFDQPYSGSLRNGYKLAEFDSREFSDGQLSPGESFTNISSRGPLLNEPPNGDYFITIVVTEFTNDPNNGGYSAADFSNFNDPVSFGSSGTPSIPPATGPSVIDIQGAYSYRISDDIVTVEIDRVQNTSQSVTTGTLRFELWALDETYSGTGSITGYKLAEYRPEQSNGRLGPGQNFFDIRFSDRYDQTLPNGEYAVVLFVTQFTGDAVNDGFEIADFGNFDNGFRIGPPEPVNSAPTDIFWATSGDIENDAQAGDIVANLGATDPDGDRLSFQLLDDAGGRFYHLPTEVATGVFYDGTPALTAPSYSIQLRVTDPAGASYTERLTVEVLQFGLGLTEQEARDVAYLYEAGLDRNGNIDLDGLNFWIDRRENGLSETDIAQAFLDSPEFANAFGPPASLSDRELVERLYRNVLDREGERAGVDFWVAVVARPDFGRDDLLLAFARSPENLTGSPFVETLEETAPGEWGFV